MVRIYPIAPQSQFKKNSCATVPLKGQNVKFTPLQIRKFSELFALDLSVEAVFLRWTDMILQNYLVSIFLYRSCSMKMDRCEITELFGFIHSVETFP